MKAKGKMKRAIHREMRKIKAAANLKRKGVVKRDVAKLKKIDLKVEIVR